MSSPIGPEMECERLINELIPFAKQMLAEHSEFYPFGGYLKVDGSIVHLAGKIEGTEHPSSPEVIAVLAQHMRSLAREGACRATALLFDVQVRSPGTSEKADAIQVNLDHSDSCSVQVFFPCSLDGAGSVQYATGFAQAGNADVFA